MYDEKNNTDIEDLKNVLKNSPDSIFLYNLDGDIIFANETACETIGYNKNDLMVKNIHDINQSNSSDEIYQNDLLNEGSTIFETINQCKDGSIIDVMVDSNILESENDKLILSIVRNKDNLGSIINDDLDKFDEIIKKTKKGIIIEDLGLITYLNHNLCDLLGYEKDEMLGHEYIDFFNGMQEFSILDEIIKAKNGGKSVVISNMLRKDGTQLLTLTTISPLYNKNGNYLGNLSMHRDISSLASIKENK